MMSMNNLEIIGVETPMIDSGCSLKKGFIELIHLNPLMVLIRLIHVIVVYVVL